MLQLLFAALLVLSAPVLVFTKLLETEPSWDFVPVSDLLTVGFWMEKKIKSEGHSHCLDIQT